MKVKIDESLPASLALMLRTMGHDAHTVYDERIAGRDDETIWNAALSERRMLITQDLGFARRAQGVDHPGLVLVRLRTPSRIALESRIRQVFQFEQVHGWIG